MLNNRFQTIPQGWQCPICGKVNSPQVKECTHNPLIVEVPSVVIIQKDADARERKEVYER